MELNDDKRVEAEASLEPHGELDAVLDSPALMRLIDEVRHEGSGGVPRSYNRTFNRHNR